MTGISKRVSALEAKSGGRKKTLFIWLPPGLTKIDQDAFIAAEEKRLAVDDNELVALSWLPVQDH